jgi:chromosome segregation ATPase
MKINDILNEAGDDSGDYQQMLAFTRANRVGGVPDAQQIPLALFKELKKQQQQNQALGAELDAAEQRIDQATQSGELSKQELGMHRTELDRERTAGDQQKAAVTQLGQQYSERERASGEQIQQLTGQLEQVRNMPGVNKSAAEALEKQIKELGERSVPVDRLQELESSIAAIQNAQTVDDAEIQDLMAQIEQAQKATQELEKTKQSIKQDVSKTVQDTQDQVEQIKQDIERLQQVEKTVATLQPLVKNVIEPKVEKIERMQDTTNRARNILAMKRFKDAENKAQYDQAAADAAQDAIANPNIDQAIGTAPQPPVAESAFARSIAWATGKRP